MTRRFRMFDSSGARNKDFEFFDRTIRENIFIGGTDCWVYRYLGPKSEESDDLTKPDFSEFGSIETDIADLVWMENASRNYDTNPVTLPLTYDMQDPNLMLQQFGIMIMDTLTMTLHYNQMIEIVGRKLMNGDVLELPHLRDYDLLDEDATGLNRFYVVHDAFRPASGYSTTWYPHLYTVKVQPLQDSPEYQDLLGGNDEEASVTGEVSTRRVNETIMDIILAQQEVEVPYMHYDSEHLYESDKDSDGNVIEKRNKDTRGQPMPPTDIESGNTFPDQPIDKQWYERSDFTPNRIYQYSTADAQWVSYDYGGRKEYVGPNQERADFINNNEGTSDEPSRVGVGDIIKPKLNF